MVTNDFYTGKEMEYEEVTTCWTSGSERSDRSPCHSDLYCSRSIVLTCPKISNCIIQNITTLCFNNDRHGATSTGLSFPFPFLSFALNQGLSTQF